MILLGMRKPGIGLWLLLAPFSIASCSPAFESMRPIETVRQVERLGLDRPRAATLAELFGTQETDPGFVYRTPPGWIERPPRSMRMLDFQVAGNPAAECYLTVLRGGAGGLEANVNRWYKQMQREELDAAGMRALPRANLLGLEAVLVDIEGSFNVGDEIRDNHRLVGLLVFHQEAGLFMKMTGPREVLDRELGNFHELARTMRLPNSSSTASQPARPRGSTPPSGGGGLKWELPEGWTPGANRPMRVATFMAGKADPVECYITFLGPGAGNELANLNRWRSQLRLEPVAQITGETRIPMLGEDALFVEIVGTHPDDSEGMMLGTICNLPGRSVFVKMLGPRQTVEPQRESFLSFCKSLRLGG